MSVHSVSLKGTRNANEDAHNIILGMHLDDKNPDLGKINYYGVYDGHGGKFISNFLSVNIPQYFTSPKVSYPLKSKYVNRVYDKIQSVLFNKYEKEATECGSTCSIVCHFKDKDDKEYINIVNTGDSRSVLCKNNIAVSLSLDHKPNWPIEKKRIEKLGGVIRKDGNVFRINDLSVSRAFGDKETNNYVTHTPDIYKYKLSKKDRFLILACDGLWDVMSSQDAVNVVLDMCYDTDMKRINRNVNIAKILANKAIELDCGDNVTCIVVFFNK